MGVRRQKIHLPGHHTQKEAVFSATEIKPLWAEENKTVEKKRTLRWKKQQTIKTITRIKTNSKKIDF